MEQTDQHAQLYADIEERSMAVLRANILPGTDLMVPHLELFGGSMFLWDLAVQARAMAYEDPQLAAGNIVHFTSGQRKSGQIGNELSTGRVKPIAQQMVFGPAEDSREPGDHRPPTSHITQPPTIVNAAYEVGQHLPEDERQQFYRHVFPKFKRYLSFLLNERTDPNDNLVILLHPYESGMDDTPPWREKMHQAWHHDMPVSRQVAQNLASAVVGEGRRRFTDGRYVPLEQRASNLDILTSYLQTRALSKCKYDLECAQRDPRIVLIKDIGFNAVLASASTALESMATQIDDPDYVIDGDMQMRMYLQQQAVIEELWDKSTMTYYSKDARTNELIPIQTVASLFPLLNKIPENHVAAILTDLRAPGKFNGGYTSVPFNSKYFRPGVYWGGSKWAFAADLLEQGQVVQGRHKLAAAFRHQDLTRPAEPFKAEYEHPITGEPLGGLGFAPMAAKDRIFVEHQKPTHNPNVSGILPAWSPQRFYKPPKRS